MAVYTPVTEAQVETFLAQYDLGALRALEPIAAGVENTNYRMMTAQGVYILTLVEKRTRAGDLPFILDYMTHLRKSGIDAPAVIAARDGRRVVPLAGKPAIITRFLQGVGVDAPDAPRAAAAGALLAHMHLAGESFVPRRPNPVGHAEWQRLVAACRGQSPLADILWQELNWLDDHKPGPLPQGAVHADLFPDNVFFIGNRVSGVIDFYFACTDVFAYDLMLTLNAWCAPRPEKAGHKEAFLSAYEAVRPLAPEERAALPYYGRAAAVRIAATRLYDSLNVPPGAFVTPKNPQEYIDILHARQKD